MKDIDQILSKIGADKAALIPILQHVQAEFGYLPSDVMEQIVEKTDITATELYGVATFYKQFRFTPVGRHMIKLCHGTACHVKGAENILQTLLDELNIQPGETTQDGLFTVEVVACLGCCSLAPVIMIDETVYGQLTAESVRRILDDYRKRA